MRLILRELGRIIVTAAVFSLFAALLWWRWDHEGVRVYDGPRLPFWFFESIFLLFVLPAWFGFWHRPKE